MLISAQARFAFVVRNGRVIKRSLIFSTIISVWQLKGATQLLTQYHGWQVWREISALLLQYETWGNSDPLQWIQLFHSSNRFNVDSLCSQLFTIKASNISLWQELVAAPFIPTEPEGCQAYSNLK